MTVMLTCSPGPCLPILITLDLVSLICSCLFRLNTTKLVRQMIYKLKWDLNFLPKFHLLLGNAPIQSWLCNLDFKHWWPRNNFSKFSFPWKCESHSTVLAQTVLCIVCCGILKQCVHLLLYQVFGFAWYSAQ